MAIPVLIEAPVETNKPNEHLAVVADARIDGGKLLLDLVAVESGRKLMTIRKPVPTGSDSEEKIRRLLGKLRETYKDFGQAWPAERTTLDPNAFLGKKTVVKLGEKKKLESVSAS